PIADLTLLSSLFAVFFFLSHAAHRALHSFPTRRSSDLPRRSLRAPRAGSPRGPPPPGETPRAASPRLAPDRHDRDARRRRWTPRDRKSTRLNSSHDQISYAVFCLKKKKENEAENQESKS